MISKWKYNYTDEEKGMVLTIQNLKQEIDKLVDTNEDINREFSQYKYESKKEIERLNNVINEYAKWLNEYTKWLNEQVDYMTHHSIERMVAFDCCKHKLQELKGGDKE